MTITFCGHADFCGNECFEEKIISVLREKMPDEIFLGGYGAFDSFAYKCAQKYKKSEAPSLRICLITPYLDPKHKKELSDSYEYDEIIYPPLENVPPRFAISRRNEWMINNSDCLIAFVERSFGGAYKTLKYAEKKEKGNNKCRANKLKNGGGKSLPQFILYLSLKLSAIIAINSELVGFPRLFWIVYPK